MRGGTTVPHMLFAGGGADYAPPAVGAFMFIMGVLPSWANWNCGSANKYFKYKNKNGVYQF